MDKSSIGFDLIGEDALMTPPPGVLNTVPVFEKKFWGRVWHRFYDQHCGESLLDVERGGRTSIHYHRNRVNVFIVVSGRIAIDLYGPANNDDFKEPGARWQQISLGPGDSMTVKTDIWHRFRVLESGRVIEVYYTTDGSPVLVDDIVRHDIGGMDA